jgi:hypothetical protein
MLTIRKEQIKVFEEVAMKQFIDDMVIHVKKYFSKESGQMSDEQLRNHIIGIIPKAKKYGLDSERDLCKYLNLSIIFGKDFDIDPELVWMAKMLTDYTESNSSLRLNRLYKEAMRRIEEKQC